MTPEELYDTEIAPLLLQASMIAKRHKIALICYAQWDADGSGRTATMPHADWPGARITLYAAKAKGNADSLILALQRDGVERGHSSVCLQLLDSNVK